MKPRNVTGLLCFTVHLLLEVTSFYILTSYIKSPFVWVIMLIYDFTAFVPQGLLGYLRDKGFTINFARWGIGVTSLALVLMWLDLNVFLVVTVLSAGNCMVHIYGAELTLRCSEGKITPAAVFVSGGSFGIIIGKMLAMSRTAVPVVLALNLLSLVPVLICDRIGKDRQEQRLCSFRFADPDRAAAVVIALATLVVAVRSYMGNAIPMLWNRTLFDTVLLYCCMGLGKAFGGVLTDLIGIRKTALISTLGAVPFLLLGANIMPVSLVGIMIFSMTMAVTLAVLVSVLKSYPGVAFGFTTLGLFLGSLPVFFFRVSSVTLNCIIIAVMSAVCMFILNFICVKKECSK